MRPAHWDEMVRLSFKLSCGCTQRKSELVKAIDAASIPGHAVVCETHQEFAIVVRISTYLEYDAEVLERLLLAGGVEADVAGYVARDQARVSQNA